MFVGSSRLSHLHVQQVKLLPNMQVCHDRLVENRARFALLAEESEKKAGLAGLAKSQ